VQPAAAAGSRCHGNRISDAVTCNTDTPVAADRHADAQRTIPRADRPGALACHRRVAWPAGLRLLLLKLVLSSISRRQRHHGRRSISIAADRRITTASISAYV